MPKDTDRLARSLRPHALVRIVVPSEDRSRRPVPSRRFQRRIEESLLQVATGTITLRGEGAWKNGKPRAVREQILLVESILPEHVSVRGANRIARRLREIAREARQEALFVVVNGRPFLLPGVVPAARGKGPQEDRG